MGGDFAHGAAAAVVVVVVAAAFARGALKWESAIGLSRDEHLTVGQYRVSNAGSSHQCLSTMCIVSCVPDLSLRSLMHSYHMCVDGWSQPQRHEATKTHLPQKEEG